MSLQGRSAGKKSLDKDILDIRNKMVLKKDRAR